MNAAITALPEGDYFSTTAGHRIHFQDLGSGEPVVFIHGSGPGASGHSNFKGNYPWLRDQGYRVIVPDLPGFGRSDKPDDVEYHIDFFVSSLLQTLDSLGVQRFTPIGNSLGGAVALQLALTHPERLSKLILMAPGGLEQQAAYFEMPGMQAMREFYTGGGEGDMRQLLKNLVHDPQHISSELVAERSEVFATQNAQVITTMRVPEVTDRLGEISCPVLAFWGINERFMPLSGILKLAGGCADIRVVVQSACGHWVMVEHAGLFNRSCLDFLRHG